MFPPLPSANLHFSNKSWGLSLSIPLQSIAISSPMNPYASCLQNSYVHLPSHRIKITLLMWVCTSAMFTSFKPSYSPWPHSPLSPWAPASAGGGVSPVLDLWWKQCGAVVCSDAKKSSAIGFMRNKTPRCEHGFWKPVPDTPETLPVPSPLSLLMG